MNGRVEYQTFNNSLKKNSIWEYLLELKKNLKFKSNIQLSNFIQFSL